jgi:hypothetical protein
MLHGASPDKAVGTRGPSLSDYRSPLLVFYPSMISTEQFFLQIRQDEEREKDLFLFLGFFVVVDHLAPVHAFPIFRKVFPVRSGFHDRIMLCAAHKTFHETCRFVHQFHHFFFLCHATIVDL